MCFYIIFAGNVYVFLCVRLLSLVLSLGGLAGPVKAAGSSVRV